MRVSLPGRHILGVLKHLLEELKHLLEEKNDITKPPTGSPDLVPNLSGFPVRAIKQATKSVRACVKTTSDTHRATRSASGSC
jgi:hypothetical protein